MDERDIGVLERRYRQGFALVTLHPPGIRSHGRMQDLDDNLLGGLIVSGLVNDTGRILSKLGLNRVVGEGPSDQRIDYLSLGFRVLDHGFRPSGLIGKTV